MNETKRRLIVSDVLDGDLGHDYCYVSSPRQFTFWGDRLRDEERRWYEYTDHLTGWLNLIDERP